MLWQTLQQSVELGWSFYIPVILFVALCALGVPIWASLCASAVAMMVMSDVLPLALLGESLFDGIDAFALTAVPLFILTGDVLVRTGLSRKFLNVADALTKYVGGDETLWHIHMTNMCKLDGRHSLPPTVEEEKRFT